MPLGENNLKTFHRLLYSGKGMLQRVTLLKRDFDQRMGTVTSFLLFGCRWSRMWKTGQPIQEDMLSDHTREIHIPVIELSRVGVNIKNINPADRFIDREGRYWQPESPQTITLQLLQTHLCVACVRIDPPKG